MDEQKSPRAQSAIDFVDTHLPSSLLLLSSEHLTWNGLTVQTFYTCPKNYLVVPSLLENMIIIYTQGVVRMQCKIGQQFQSGELGVGRMFLIPAGVPTEWEWQELEGCSELLQLCLDPTLLHQVAVEVADIDPSRIELIEQVAFHDPLIYHIGLALRAELQSGGIAGGLYARVLTHTLAVHLLRNYAVFPLLESRQVLSRPVVQRVTDYINDHLADDLSLAKLAALAHLSPYHFTRLFKQTTGQSVHQYVIERRIEAARLLLLAGHLTVAEVAVLVGFYDQSHLARHFKRHVGAPPSHLLTSRKNIPGRAQEYTSPA
jgi:AraC family transcriptional regulator